MAEPVLLFCVGAAKAGTSWLHRYLSDHPECHMRPIKELHYFDALDFGQVGRQIAEVERMRAAVVARVDTAADHQVPALLGRVAAFEHYLELMRLGHEDPMAYLGYLFGEHEGQKVVADMTPAYSLLSVDRLRMMAGLLPRTRFLYLMRDPVDRLWSHVRMMAVRRDRVDETVGERASRILQRVIQGREAQIELRSDYRTALLNLAEATGEGQLCIVTFDDLFDGTATDRICDFLGISRREAPRGKVVHEGPHVALSDEERAAARDWLAPQYDFVRMVLPEVADRWESKWKQEP